MIIEEEEEDEEYDDTFDTEVDDCQEEDVAHSKSHDSQQGEAFFMTAVRDNKVDFTKIYINQVEVISKLKL